MPANNLLFIETSHGFVELADFEIQHRPRTWGDRKGTYAVAVGRVVASRETSRLFWATSSSEVYPVGQIVEYAVYREPYCTDKAAGKWRVSTVTCG